MRDLLEEVMFDQDLQGKIRAIGAKVSDKDGNIDRYCMLGLQFEFTKELAGGIGKEAKELQKQLASGSLAAATLHMDAVTVLAKFDAGDGAKDKLELGEAKGVAVALKKANKEDAHPTAKLTLRFPTVRDHLLFFVDHLEETVGIKLIKEQTELKL
jgi:hypothetical protein